MPYVMQRAIVTTLRDVSTLRNQLQLTQTQSPDHATGQIVGKVVAN
jgi:hypothetical protein